MNGENNLCNESTMITIVCRSMRWFGTISAAIALGLFLLVVPAHSQSVADYIAALGDKNPKVRRASLEKILAAYGKYDECDLACLSTEEAAIVGFSPDDFSKLTTAVIKLLSDPDPKIRGLAIQYSASSTDARVLEPVARLLSEVDDEVRAMVTGLFEFYSPNNDEIISRLEHLLKDKTAKGVLPRYHEQSIFPGL